MLCGQGGWRLKSSISEWHIGANRFADGVAKALPSGALFLLEHDQGLGPHKHFGFLSLLLHNEVPGLQVQLDWLSTLPVPGMLMVNLGETHGARGTVQWTGWPTTRLCLI